MSTAAEWTLLEKLMLAQAVYKLGEDDWMQIASNLSQNSLLNRQPDFFNKEHCSQEYSRLLQGLMIDKSSPSNEPPQSNERPVVQLAKQLYTQRVDELKRDLEETNTKYSTLTHEIEEIRAGKWDERLLAQAGHRRDTPAATTTPAAPPPSSAPSLSPTAAEQSAAQDATTEPTTVKSEPMDITPDSAGATDTTTKVDQPVKQEPSSAAGSPHPPPPPSPPSAAPAPSADHAEVPHHTPATPDVAVPEGTHAHAEAPTSIPSPSPATISSTQPSSSSSPSQTAVDDTRHAVPSHTPSPSPSPSSERHASTPPPPPPAAAATVDQDTIMEDAAAAAAADKTTLPAPAPAEGETRQETANVPSMVLAPSPKEALSAEPHITAQPTMPVQIEPRPPSGQAGSEDSFHSAEEMGTQAAAATAAATAAAAAASSAPVAAEEAPSSLSPPRAPPATSAIAMEQPDQAVPVSGEEATAPEQQPTQHETLAPADEAGHVTVLKRKAEEEEEEEEERPGDLAATEVKRQRLDDASVTQPGTDSAVADDNAPVPMDTTAAAMSPQQPQPQPQPQERELPPSTPASVHEHSVKDEGEEHEEDEYEYERHASESSDAIAPSPATRTPASMAGKSPEAQPLSLSEAKAGATTADTESVTGSESNAATPTTGGPPRRNKDEQRQQKSWQKNINLLWREIANHKNGAVFMNPIKEATAPLYYEIIKHPMDLKAIKNRIREGAIKSTVEFERDIVLMLANSLMYNREGTEMYQMALEMLDDVSEQLKLFKTADSNSPPTSHTRKASTIAKDRRKSVAE